MPSPPISLKPAVITINPLTLFFPQSSAIDNTLALGITNIAISISSGTSKMLLYTFSPKIESQLGLIG